MQQSSPQSLAAHARHSPRAQRQKKVLRPGDLPWISMHWFTATEGTAGDALRSSDAAMTTPRGSRRCLGYLIALYQYGIGFQKRGV